MARRAYFIGSEIYRNSSYGRKHPLAIPRVSTTMDLVRALDLVTADQYIDSPRATPDDLARFHDRDYIAAVAEAESIQRIDPERRERYNLGRMENPIFPEMFRRPATAAGASMLAARLLSEPGVIYNPAGGTHHGRPARASGFCYFNDPVLGILALLDAGFRRIAYVDLDAHHGDGVQDAFADDARVFTISLHEEGRWPNTGSVDDRAGGWARNLPVPSGLNDSELDFLLTEAVVPLTEDFRPEVLVVQGGCDALEDDPLSQLAVSNGALWRAIAMVTDLSDRVLVLGGGGYNPWSVGRCWTGVWATVSGAEWPRQPNAEARAVLGGLSWTRRQGQNPPQRWFNTLVDPPNAGVVRREIGRIVDRVLAVKSQKVVHPDRG